MRELRVRTGSDGVVSLTGKLDPEGGARVLEVLNSLNARRPAVDGVPDLRDPARRNADALVEAMTSLLDDEELPTRVGNVPTWSSPWASASWLPDWEPRRWTPAGASPPAKPAGWRAMQP